MLALPRPFRLAALAVLASVALAACTREGLGATTAGRTGVTTARGFNVSIYAEGKRRQAPRFHGPALKGSGVITQDYLAGHIGVVNFWGSWCGPCRREERALEKLWKQYGPGGVRFLGVNLRDSRPNALAFVEEFGVTYPSIFNPDSSIAYKFRVIFAPVTFVIDARGRIAAKILGALRSADDLSRLLERELRGRR